MTVAAELAPPRQALPSGSAAQRVGDGFHDLVDLALLDDEGRRDGEDVAGLAHENAVLVAIEEHIVAALAGLAWARFKLDAGNEAYIADVDDVRAAPQRMDRLLHGWRKRGGALEQAFALVYIERREPRRAGHRVAGIGIAVEELDKVLRTLHERVVDAPLHEHGPHGYGAVGDALGGGHEVGCDAEILRREGRAKPAKSADDLIKDKQKAVLDADRLEPFEIALGRNQNASRAGHGLNDHRGDGVGAMQRDQPFEIVRKLRAIRRLALGEGIARDAVRMPQMVHAGSIGPKVRRLLPMPPTDMPPKPTP